MLMNGSWKDKDLTWRLINSITEDPIIKHALFPSLGSVPRSGPVRFFVQIGGNRNCDWFFLHQNQHNLNWT